MAATCVRGRGRFYQGRVNVTKSGIPCQPWDAQEPHSHNRPPNVFPEIRDADNFCRNAGGEEPSPWCYTTDPRRRWEHCDIPQCEHSYYQQCIGFTKFHRTRAAEVRTRKTVVTDFPIDSALHLVLVLDPPVACHPPLSVVVAIPIIFPGEELRQEQRRLHCHPTPVSPAKTTATLAHFCGSRGVTSSSWRQEQTPPQEGVA
ncbi:tyrosine-protein kinase transmembrane receptor Ror2-like [Tropilaelaps mercedesae]|uniref:Tyrosine-protein kinase transmembrane receptor Ror2-like n=1 Tax=Tropilaelaps mercedesae TaxID=418985 RepID=A0A1V9XBD7_9ACAR|nr:tyrosine-protein kinase transmembrane receptor Ror2-like [Tropilaelaps mercedesae]